MVQTFEMAEAIDTLKAQLEAAQQELASIKAARAEAAAQDTPERIAADKAAGLIDDTEAGLRTAALRS